MWNQTAFMKQLHFFHETSWFISFFYQISRFHKYVSLLFSVKMGCFWRINEVLHGSKLGPIIFNLFVTDLLYVFNHSNLGASIGTILIVALGFAKNNVLISDKPLKLQFMLNIYSNRAKKNSMAFNSSKYQVMLLIGASTQVKFTSDETILDFVRTK